MTKLNDGLPSNLDHNVKYRLRHPDRVKESSKKYSETHKEQIKEYNRKWREKNKESLREKSKEYYKNHSQEMREYHKKYNQENKEVLREKARNRTMPKKYGISKDEYDFLLLQQEGQCAICGRGDNYKREFCVDHDHRTGRIRGLLCHPCNQALGLFGDNLTVLETAVSYLKDKS